MADFMRYVLQTTTMLAAAEPIPGVRQLVDEIMRKCQRELEEATFVDRTFLYGTRPSEDAHFTYRGPVHVGPTIDGEAVEIVGQIEGPDAG